MLNVALICFLIIIYIDISNFKQKDERAFRDIFHMSRRDIYLIFFVIAFLLFFSPKKMAIAPLFVLSFVFPFYFIRRNRFIKMTSSERSPEVLLSDAYGVVVLWFFSIVFLAALTKGFGHLFLEEGTKLGEVVISAVFSSVILLLLVYRASRKFSDQGFWANVGFSIKNNPISKIFIFPAALGLVFAYFSSSVIFQRQSQPITPLSEVINTSSSSLAILGFLMLAVLIAPLVEEIIFRGYFFHVIKVVRGQRFAIYFIALTFAFLHVGQYWGDWLAIFMVTILGFALTLFRAWTGTTLASVIMHYAYNGGVTFIPLIMLILSNPAYFKYQAYYSQYDAETKEELLIQSIQNQPDLAEAYNNLAWLYTEENKNLEKALELVDSALRFDPENLDFLDTKAVVLYKLDRLEEYHAIYERLVEEGYYD